MAEEGCPFCGIARDESPAEKVYEDDEVLAFLDIKPVNHGHTLVIPKEHHRDIHDTPEELLGRVYAVAKKVAAAQRDALSPGGISTAQNNGAPAGQIVFHLHVHVIPKDERHHSRFEPGEEDLKSVGEKLRNAISGQ